MQVFCVVVGGGQTLCGVVGVVGGRKARFCGVGCVVLATGGGLHVKI